MNPLIITCLSFFIVQLDTTILYVAFPAIQKSFPASSAETLGWVINAYTILFGSFLIPAGAYSDQFGRKKFFMSGVFIFTLASFLCGMSTSVNQLIYFRALQAVGAALLIPSSLALVLSTTEQSKRAVAVSIWSAVGGLAAAVGPSLGALLITYYGWQYTFFINVPIGVLILAGTYFNLKESSSPQSTVPSIIGSGLLALTLISLSMCFSESGVSNNFYLWLGAFVTMLLIFIVFNKKIHNPALDFSLFNNKTILTANVGTFLFAVGFSAAFLSFVIYLTKVWSYSILEAGLALTPGPLTVIPTSIIAGKYAAKHGHKKIIIAGGIIFTIGLLFRIYWPAQDQNLIQGWFPMVILIGIGTGLLMPSFGAAATFHLPKDRYAMGSGLNNTLRQSGAVIGVSSLIMMTKGEAANLNAVFAFSIFCVVISAFFGSYVRTRPVSE